MDSFGKKLVALRAELGAEGLARLISDDRDYEGLRVRINRLTCIDDDFRLDQMRSIVPSEIMFKVPFDGHPVTVYRGLPGGAEVLPGDWVSLERSYAAEHAKSYSGHDGQVKHLECVDPMDVYWAGSDEREFFYLPRNWQRPGMSTSEYLASISAETLRMLGDGEMARINENANRIQAVSDAVFDGFDPDECGFFHGPEHWNRVRAHGLSQARAAGVDPLLSHLFALVHDSQRENDDLDPEHGPRAAKWIHDNPALFDFLGEDDVRALMRACELHSTGEISDERLDVMACWDADRLDLWRVGIEPLPNYLCLDNAKRASVIRYAEVLVKASNDTWDSRVELRQSPWG